MSVDGYWVLLISTDLIKHKAIQRKLLFLAMNTSGQQRDPILVFMEDLFKEYRNDSLPYCLLRGNVGLLTDGGDIDLLVEQQYIERAVSLSVRIVERLNGAIVFYSYSYLNHYLIIAFHDMSRMGGQIQVLPLHFQTEMAEGCTVFEVSSLVLKEFVREDVYCQPTPEMEAALIVLHSVVGKKSFKAHYWEFIRKVYGKSNLQFRDSMSRIFGPNLASKIIKGISDGDKNSVIALRKEIQSIGNNDGCLVFRKLYNRLLRRLKWIVTPPGIFVNLEGSVYSVNLDVAMMLSEMMDAAPREVKHVSYSQKKPCRENVGILQVMKEGIWCIFFYMRTVRPMLVRNGIVISVGYHLPIIAMKSGKNSIGTRLIESMMKIIIPAPNATAYVSSCSGCETPKLTEENVMFSLSESFIRGKECGHLIHTKHVDDKQAAFSILTQLSRLFIINK